MLISVVSVDPLCVLFVDAHFSDTSTTAHSGIVWACPQPRKSSSCEGSAEHFPVTAGSSSGCIFWQEVQGINHVPCSHVLVCLRNGHVGFC